MNIIKTIESIRFSFIGAEIVYAENSYGLYVILKTIFPEAEAYVQDGNVVTKIDNMFYNIAGRTEGQFIPLTDKLINFYKKNYNEGVYKRITIGGPAAKKPGRKIKVLAPNAIFTKYYYGFTDMRNTRNIRKLL